jgi:LuxR family maltose regulon positive regulatory protein
VISHLPEEERDFLLRTSVLAEFCAELCDFVLQIDYSRRLIEEVRNQNLFLIARDAEQGWYRYHALFAEFLRAQLAHEAPLAPPELHRRAARWYSEHNLFAEAVEHAFAIADAAFAANLLGRCAMDFVRGGRITALVRWLDVLPDEQITAHPLLLRAAAYAFAFAHRYGAADALLKSFRQRSKPAPRESVRAIHWRCARCLGWTDQVEISP